jgi:phosphoribosylformimino-5-aminoimidazole carboxamide ribotide isomerase
MKLIPAIDLIGGRCVRLVQGDFARETVYSGDPRQAIASFAAAGADEVHLVDLDGARAGQPRQHQLFADLLADSEPELQLAGGFRTVDQVRRMLDAGAARVVIGSLALDDPAEFDAMLDAFGPDRITLALDVRMAGGKPMVASHGWLNDSGQSLASVLTQFPAVRHLLVTDITRDGMMSGPNVALMQSIRSAFPDVELQASGGVASLEDLAVLRSTGAARAIVGKAIWEGAFTVAEGLDRARG